MIETEIIPAEMSLTIIEDAIAHPASALAVALNDLGGRPFGSEIERTEGSILDFR